MFGHAEIVGLKGLSLRNLSAAGGQVSFVNRARPTKKIPRLLAAGSFILLPGDLVNEAPDYEEWEQTFFTSVIICELCCLAKEIAYNSTRF